MAIAFVTERARGNRWLDNQKTSHPPGADSSREGN